MTFEVKTTGPIGLSTFSDETVLATLQAAQRTVDNCTAELARRKMPTPAEVERVLRTLEGDNA